MVAKSYKLSCCAVCLTIERDRELDHQRNFAACWVNCWLFQERSSQYISGGWIWWLSLTPRRLIWTNSSSLNYCVYLWLEFPFNNIGDHLVRQLRRVEGVLEVQAIYMFSKSPPNFNCNVLVMNLIMSTIWSEVGWRLSKRKAEIASWWYKWFIINLLSDNFSRSANKFTLLVKL